MKISPLLACNRYLDVAERLRGDEAVPDDLSLGTVRSPIMKNCQTLEQHILEAINQMREVQGITLVELSRRTGIDAARLGNVLRGDRAMRADELALLMVVLQIPIKAICPLKFIPWSFKSDVAETIRKLESGE